ncbi:MAG: hypothetical protein K2W95_09915 [Candidatus Obscuribacterales bacterium]|nr:hypothetical protein [Candidatus Obscuribacterales bacterium]
MSTGSETSVSWLNLTVEGFKLDVELSSSRFNKVYLGMDAGGSARIFKVAKGASELDDDVTQESSCGLLLMTGSFTGIRPNTNELLKIEFRKLAGLACASIPSRISLTTDKTARAYMMMKYVPGNSLRSVIESGKADLSTMCAVAESVQSLLGAGIDYHGDLKPENICITTSGAPVIFDVGYFGALQTDAGLLENCAITTPLYYPSLRPNDLFAFACILWEALLQVHPLRSKAGSSLRCSDNLSQHLQIASQTGSSLIRGLGSIPRPKDIKPDISCELEVVLLKALGLSISGDELIPAPTYGNIAALASDLRRMLA